MICNGTERNSISEKTSMHAVTQWRESEKNQNISTIKMKDNEDATL